MDAVTERCGACGTEVPSDAEVCSACGALLDAYRPPAPVDPFAAPSQTDSVPVVVPPPQRQASAIPRFDRTPLLEEVTEADPELREARRRLLQTLAAPGRDLLDVVEFREVEQLPPARVERPPSEQVRVIETPRSSRRAEVRTIPSKPRGAKPMPSTPSPPPPRRPGYVVRGTVEPIILIGVTLFSLACFAAAVGSMFGSSAWLGIGLTAAAIGVIATLGAVLVALVRRDSERG